MGDEATPATLTQVNAEFLNARASRLDSAISAALAGRVEAPKPPKAGKVTRTATAATSPTASPSPASPQLDSGSVTSDEATPAEPQNQSAPVETTPGEASADEPQDEATEAEQPAIDRAELAKLAKKKDLRGLEKQLGLEEGVLGATNGEYAALRRRMDDVEKREATVQATHEQNNQTLINKFGPAVDAIQRAQKGDLHAYARTIELTTGIRIATFIEHYAKNVGVLDPRVLQLEQENARLRAQGQIVTQDGQIEKPAVTQEAARKKADERIAAEAKDHPALKLRGGADDVRQRWLSSFDKATQSFRLTPKQAADAVIEDRRKAHEQEQWILSGKKPPKKPVTRTVSRTGASETQPRKSNLTREQIIEQHAKLIRQQKQAAR